MRAKIGDIIEIKTREGLAYAQFTTVVAPYGALIRVFDEIFQSRPKNLAMLPTLPIRFSNFFPLTSALNQGVVTRVGNEPVPPHLRAQSLFRYGLPDPVSRKVEEWFLWRGDVDYTKVEKLTPELSRLPTTGVWNIDFLVEKIEDNWRPEQDAD